VLEIGPGLGALTQFLIPVASKYLAYEIDVTLKKELLARFGKYANSQFIFNDFMESDVKQELQDYFGSEEIHLVANLPYYITTPIIFKFLEFEQLKTATIMVQKEVGERLISSRSNKSYNALSAILQFYCQVDKVIDVNKKMFNPVPKVDSMVIRLSKIPLRLTNDQLYVTIAKALFSQKRKTILNNLSSVFNQKKDFVRTFLNNLDFNDNLRAEQLSIDDIIKITTHWKIEEGE
jgi:16S rRNA (adenine1518-N6/adenine1519-N6)-dimethyltransferase